MRSVVVPMQPTLARQPFSNPDWLFEPKWDGYRAICFLQDGKVRFVSKNNKSLTERFPDLQGITKSIKAESAILDGEIVALDKKGVPCFDGLRSRRSVGECVIVFYAFDLLFLDGQEHTQRPLISRKAALKKILPKRHTARVRYTDHIVGEGERLFDELEKRRLEGMVAKLADSVYVGGRTRAWLKIKTSAGREEMSKRSEAWKL
jgi:bifunctional non-homologous end joining protein LigD